MARIKLAIPEKALFTTTINVRISDINYGNHLGNDALVSILHEARVHWLSSLGYTELNVAGTALIMGDLAVEYRAESFYGDALLIAISIGEITKKSFEMYYQLTTKRNDKNIVIANAKTGIVCFDYTTKKVVNIPVAFLAILQA